LSLLFDQNISPRIVKHLTSIFPEAKHVRHVGLEDESDTKIFEFAKQHNLAIADNIDLIQRFLKSDQPEHQILEIIKNDLL
jgi:predicted nuclease of predicted toxin-antitoxin system